MIYDKIKTREELTPICDSLRKQGLKIGFTSGAFDILHAGHVNYLEKARAICHKLIVGINTDTSIRSYKGENRPVLEEKYRVKVIAALESVDFVFLFEERRNKKNIEQLKPDYYIKAGDYSDNTLTSKEIVEENGGEVRLIPIEDDISTTEITERIADYNSLKRQTHIIEDGTEHIHIRPPKKSPAIFFDRDGTINKDINYLHEPEKFELLPNAALGMKKFQDMGYRIIIITNQPGIGMGYFSKEDFFAVNREMLKQFSKHGILVDKIYFCPHSKSAQCDCRKPGTKFIELAQRELNPDLEHSYILGDKTSDIETGRVVGIQTILVKTGNKGEDGEYDVKPDLVADDLLDAAMRVLDRERE